MKIEDPQPSIPPKPMKARESVKTLYTEVANDTVTSEKKEILPVLLPWL